MSNRSEPGTAGHTQALILWLIPGIMLIAANLRAPLTVLGPLVGDIQAHFHLSNTLTGVLSALPLLAFAVLSPLAPGIARRIGMEAALMASLAMLAAGVLLRSVPAVAGLFAGTLVIGLGIAVGNVLLPSLIKRDFPQRVGSMTGAYTTAMNVFAALASGVSIPFSQVAGFGWRGALACWAILAGIAALCWLPQLRRRRAHVASAPVKAARMWRSKLAWQVTLFMGLQSFLFYVNANWLPELLYDRGLSKATAGWMLSGMQFVSLPFSFLVPILAARSRNQKGIVAGLVLCNLIAYLGLLFTNDLAWTWLWIVCIGIAVGAGIGLALAFFGLRTRNARQAAELSGMAQSIGYLLAAAGPILFGFLHDVTHAWTSSLLALIVVSVLLLLAGLGAGRSLYVKE